MPANKPLGSQARASKALADKKKRALSALTQSLQANKRAKNLSDLTLQLQIEEAHALIMGSKQYRETLNRDHLYIVWSTFVSITIQFNFKDAELPGMKLQWYKKVLQLQGL
jgi:hypothetical protein